jgi:hypothetical protein
MAIPLRRKSEWSEDAMNREECARQGGNDLRPSLAPEMTNRFERHKVAHKRAPRQAPAQS